MSFIDKYECNASRKNIQVVDARDGAVSVNHMLYSLKEYYPRLSQSHLTRTKMTPMPGKGKPGRDELVREIGTPSDGLTLLPAAIKSLADNKVGQKRKRGGDGDETPSSMDGVSANNDSTLQPFKRGCFFAPLEREAQTTGNEQYSPSFRPFP